VSPEESTTAVMALMTRRRAHLPVMDRGRLLGIVSIGDVVKDRLHDLEIVASVRRGAHVVMHWRGTSREHVRAIEHPRLLRNETRFSNGGPTSYCGHHAKNMNMRSP
jgi:hypothetical protein